MLSLSKRLLFILLLVFSTTKSMFWKTKPAQNLTLNEKMEIANKRRQEALMRACEESRKAYRRNVDALTGPITTEKLWPMDASKYEWPSHPIETESLIKPQKYVSQEGIFFFEE